MFVLRGLERATKPKQSNGSWDQQGERFVANRHISAAAYDLPQRVLAMGLSNDLQRLMAAVQDRLRSLSSRFPYPLSWARFAGGSDRMSGVTE